MSLSLCVCLSVCLSVCVSVLMVSLSVGLGHTNNVHCLAKAVNALAGALFTVHGPGDVEMRLKEFLAVSCMLTVLWGLIRKTSSVEPKKIFERNFLGRSLGNFFPRERMHIFESSLENVFGTSFYEDIRNWCILETSLERSLEKFGKICRKALTLSYKRKLRNNNKVSTKVRHVDT